MEVSREKKGHGREYLCIEEDTIKFNFIEEFHFDKGINEKERYSVQMENVAT